jgi:hypothetical protein
MKFWQALAIESGSSPPAVAALGRQEAMAVHCSIDASKQDTMALIVSKKRML